jgi:poly(3-hydroxybutyrate) depolymerase
MRYSAFAMTRAMSMPLAWMLDSASAMTDIVMEPLKGTLAHGIAKASFELPLRLVRSYEKQPYNLKIADDRGELLAVPEEVVLSTPFCDLVNFQHEKDQDKPKVLIVAAMSGHFATLLRDTAEAFAADNDVYITDWVSARDIPVEDGAFSFDDYVAHVVQFIEHLGPNTHVVAACQSGPQALIATALLAESNPALNPSTLTLMAAPIDTRINPGPLNKMSAKFNTDILGFTNITTVPFGFKGAGRKVYPGYFQVSGFMTMHAGNHIKKHVQYAKDIASGNDEAVEKHRVFYDEYYTALDMTEAFYLETLDRVFFDQKIPKGTITYRGESVDFSKIKETALLTLEGGKDDLCPVGQTRAAQDICSGISDSDRQEFIHPDVGHYGIFSGSHWREDLYPVVQAFVDEHHPSAI